MRPKHVPCAEKTKFVVIDGNTYVNFDMIHNNETNFLKTIYRAKPPNIGEVRNNGRLAYS